MWSRDKISNVVQTFSLCYMKWLDLPENSDNWPKGEKIVKLKMVNFSYIGELRRNLPLSNLTEKARKIELGSFLKPNRSQCAVLSRTFLFLFFIGEWARNRPLSTSMVAIYDKAKGLHILD